MGFSSSVSKTAAKRVAEDPTRMRDLLQHHLRVLSDKTYEIEDCQVAGVHRREGSRSTTQYTVRLRESDTGRSWEQMVTGVVYGGERTRRLWDALREAQTGFTPAPDRPALAPFAYVPELDMLVQVFPHDHRLPGIASLMAGPPPELTRAMATELGPGNWEITDWKADVVQYRVAMRAILRLDITAVEAAGGRMEKRQFYAKVYRDSDEGRRHYRTQTDLHERVARNTHLAVAAPVVYLDPLHAVVTASAPGTSLQDLVRRGENLDAPVRAVARAVAALHRLDMPAPPRPVEDEIARLREAQDSLRSARPDLAQVAADVADAVAAGLESAPSAVIHGDLKPDHILVDGDRVTLLDFDLIAQADPIVDVAHLIAFLGKGEGRARGIKGQRDTAASRFVDEYFTHAPETWRPRLPLYHAMSAVHKAAGMQRRNPERSETIARVLVEGKALLAGDAGDGRAPSFTRRITRNPAGGQVNR